jgi:hypothetical protein
MISVGECPWELIICLRGDLKNDFGEVEEAMFQGVEWPFEFIFFNLSIQKSNLDEVT